MLTIHPTLCPLPQYFHGQRCKMFIVDADTHDEAVAAHACAMRKGWSDFMGLGTVDAKTGLPSLVFIKTQD